MSLNASDTIGKRLSVARRKRGVSMADLGNKAGLSASAIGHIEKLRSNPTAQSVEALAKALDVDPCWLAYGTGTKPDWLTKKDGAGESGAQEPGR